MVWLDPCSGPGSNRRDGQSAATRAGMLPLTAQSAANLHHPSFAAVSPDATPSATGALDSNESPGSRSRPLLSIVMPVYNEVKTIQEICDIVLALPIDLELIAVDDGSKDGSREKLQELAKDCPDLRVFLQPANRGKGAAVRKGIEEGKKIRPRDGLIAIWTLLRFRFGKSWRDECA